MDKSGIQHVIVKLGEGWGCVVSSSGGFIRVEADTEPNEGQLSGPQHRVR
jgi:hypothetical protein